MSKSTPDYQQVTRLGRTTTIDYIGLGVYMVTLSFGPLGPAQWLQTCRNITEAELFVIEHGWPVPADELAVS